MAPLDVSKEVQVTHEETMNRTKKTNFELNIDVKSRCFTFQLIGHQAAVPTGSNCSKVSGDRGCLLNKTIQYSE